MSTSIAIASAVAAADLACRSLVKGYTHDGSSPSEIHEYVACVERLYPTPEWHTPMPVRVSILAMLLGIAIGAILNSYDRVLGAAVGFLVSIVGLFLAGLVILLFL